MVEEMSKMKINRETTIGMGLTCQKRRGGKDQCWHKEEEEEAAGMDTNYPH